MPVIGYNLTWKRTPYNLKCAHMAGKALAQYQPDKVERSQDYAISDLICDLLHLAARRGYDPDEVLNRARWMHFECERKGIEV